MTLAEDELVARLGTLTVVTGKRKSPGEEIKGGGGGEEEDEPVSPVARLFHEPGFNCHIIYAVGFTTCIDVDVLKSGLQSTLLHHPRFSSIPVFDKKGVKVEKWARTKVLIDDHIVIPDGLDTSASPDRVLEDYASSLSRTPMDLSRPLWELHVLDFPTSDAAAVVLFRIHHSLGDGVSLTSLLLACTRKTSDPTALPSFPMSRQAANSDHRPTPGPVAFLLWLGAALILLWHTLVDVLLFVATSAFLEDTITPLKGTAGVALRPKRFAHRIVSLDEIKDIKDAVNCTVNDVLIGVTSAALTRYIHRKYSSDVQASGDSTDDDNKKKKLLPRNIRLRSSMLVNIRPPTKLHALSDLMEGKCCELKWGNRLGYWIMPFHIVKYKDPLEYVRKGKAIADWKKKSLEAPFTFRSGLLIVKCFGMKVLAALCKRMLFNTTFTFSNIIGPVEGIGFYGHPIAYLAPSVYGHPHALTVHFQSYVNIMTIVLAVDESAIPDPHLLLDDFVESLKLIKEAIPTRSLSIKVVKD